MERQRFDDFARSWAQGRSRRTILHLIGGAVLAIVAPRRVVAAYPDPDTCQTQPGGHCTTHFPCCSGTCNDGGTCGCAKPEVECNEHCLDPKTFDHDEVNCGACGNRCPFGWECRDGTCYANGGPDHCGVFDKQCPDDWACCDGECRDIHGNDTTNCGDCDRVCAGICTNGSCHVCAKHGHDCHVDDDCCDGVCTDGICRCLWALSSCTSDDECCSHNCINGRCGCLQVNEGGSDIPDCYDCCVHECGGHCRNCRETAKRCTRDEDCCGDHEDPPTKQVCIKGTCWPASSHTA